MVEFQNKYQMGVRRFNLINWMGAYTLYKKETLRILKVFGQTIIGPIGSSILFLLVISRMTQKRYPFNDPVTVLANGSFPTHPIAKKYLNKSGTIICTDGAADKLIGSGRNPDIIIGDFDSTSIKGADRTGKWIEKPDQYKTNIEKTF